MKFVYCCCSSMSKHQRREARRESAKYLAASSRSSVAATCSFREAWAGDRQPNDGRNSRERTGRHNWAIRRAIKLSVPIGLLYQNDAAKCNPQPLRGPTHVPEFQALSLHCLLEMKGKRAKQYRKQMQQYGLTFGFREPYQVLGGPSPNFTVRRPSS